MCWQRRQHHQNTAARRRRYRRHIAPRAGGDVAAGAQATSGIARSMRQAARARQTACGAHVVTRINAARRRARVWRRGLDFGAARANV
jgi:hypothetical protein